MESKSQSTRKETIGKARQYLDNARLILRGKAGFDDGYYLNKKYVKVAGKKAYAGMLRALDQYLGNSMPSPKDVEWYEEHLTVLDRKMLSAFDTAYRILDEMMGRKGISNAELAEIGISNAQQVVDWVEIQTGT